MAFTPRNVPGEPKELPFFLGQEFRNVATATAEMGRMMQMEMLYVAPKRFSEGCVCFADGTSWNPGSGRGLYVYHTGAWRKLG